jgi:6-phosphogluconolactonase
MTHERIVAPGLDALGQIAARRIEALIAGSIQRSGRCRIALSGGGTPGPIYRLLATASLPWEHVQVFFADERCVPPEHAASNYRMVQATLLGPAAVPASNVHRIEAELPQPAEAAERYAPLLEEPMDVLVLGIGADGHTASLFPGGPELRETSRLAVHSRSPQPPHDRVTITSKVLASAAQKVMLATGSEKAAAVAKALRPGASHLKVPACLAWAGIWVMDREASALL